MLAACACCAQQVPDIAKDIGVISAEIQAAETEDSKYAGGLIKSLIAARLGILR